MDNYTAKKLLPRLLISAIIINLSIYLVALALDLTNIIGAGIYDLITAPFNQGAQNGLHLHISVLAQAMTAVGALWAGFHGGFLHFLLMGILVPAFLIIIAVLVTLIIRQAIIFLLIFVAPVALALYCLPNTEQYFRKWWDLLFRALMIYPIIGALFAISNVLASVLGNLNLGGSLGQAGGQILGMAALFAPLLLIPFAFRLAGGVIGQLHQAAHSRIAQPGLEAAQKSRAAKRQEHRAAMKNFDRFSERTRLGRGVNNVVGAFANPRSMLNGRSGIIAARTARQTSHGQNLLRDNAIWQANQQNDPFLLAVANRNLAQEKRDKALRKSQDLTLSQTDRDSALMEAKNYENAMDLAAAMGSTGQSRAVRINALQSLAKTGFQFDENDEGYEQLRSTVADIVGGDPGMRSSVMNEAQYNLRQAGRYDLGGINHGAGFSPKTGTDKGSLYALANAKPAAIDGLMRPLQGQPIGMDHAVAYKELDAMKANATGATRDRIVAHMEALEKADIKKYLMQDSGQKDVRRQNLTEYARGNMTPAQVRAAAAADGWNLAEITQGYRAKEINLTNDQLAQKTARAYERPDPNRLNE